jgi:CBS domain-containing protein
MEGGRFVGLRQNILDDPIAELDLREVLAVTPQTPVREAVALMRRKRLGCVVVLDEQNRPVGKFTERLLLNLLHRNPQAMEDPIEPHMSRDPESLGLTEPIAKLLDLMQRKSLRFVIVTDDHGKAGGLTGQKGLMEYIAEHFARLVKVQEMDAKLSIDQREGA